jgi:hypothetical protein
MSKVFQGSINVEIRDPVPDWAPFEPPKAPEGAPNVVWIGTTGRNAEHRPDRGGRGPVRPMAHHGAVLADPVVPADRAQSHP